MKDKLFDKPIFNKDNMYKTLESPRALKEYQQIQFEVSRIKSKHTKAMQRGYTLTWFIIYEILGYLAHSMFYQKLRSRTR